MTNSKLKKRLGWNKRFSGVLAVAFSVIMGAAISLPVVSVADVVVFKDGRKMHVENAWVEGDEIKAKVYGGVVGYPKGSVERIEKEQTSTRTTDNAFKFDKWVSGMSVDEVMKVAETHDIPLQRVGSVSANKRFNPNVKKYAKTATAFYYKENLLGRWSTVTLSFTPVSKLLWSVDIKWSGSGISTKGEFRNEVESLLSEKYGKPRARGKDLLFDTVSWEISKMSLVSMKAGFGSINLSYVDKKIEAMKTNEDLLLKEQAKKKSLLKDKSKY